MTSGFLSGVTAMLVLTGIATAAISLLIRLGWRRGKSLEDL